MGTNHAEVTLRTMDAPVHKSERGNGAQPSTDEWLPGGTAAPIAPPAVAEPALPAPVETWIAPERAERQRAPAAEPLAPPRPDTDSEALRERLRAAERRADAAEQRAAKLEEQLRTRQQGDEAARRSAEARSSRLAAARAAEAAGAQRADGPLDLNSVTFETLRALGLSVSQAARFIGQRDERGGFRSLDELDRLYGLPGDLKQTLKQSGTV